MRSCASFINVLRLNFSASYTSNKMASTITMRPKGQTVDISGQTIHYEKTGNGHHNVLLMPGALGSTRTDFTPQLDNLSHQLFTIYSFDPPGYGFSRPPDRTFPKKFLHRDSEIAVKLLQALNVEKVSLVGWSDGGITALITAANSPKLVHKMVVFGANAYVTAKDVQLYESVRDIDKWSPKMRTAMINLYGENYFRQTWSAWVDAISSYENGDVCKKELKNIQCSTLIIHGSKDPMVPSEHPQYLLENIKGSKLVEFADGKHNLHLQFAEKFNKIVQDFLQEN